MMKRIGSRIHGMVRGFVAKLAHRLIQKAMRHQALIIIDGPREESIRGLLEEELDDGLAKLHLSGVRRLIRLLENQAAWYGVPLRHVRLYSTICPFDGFKHLRLK